MLNEIEEFYSYLEIPQLAENMKAFEGSFKQGAFNFTLNLWLLTMVTGEWTKASIQQRRIYIEFLLESLEHRDTEIRFMNARRLFYVLQGSCLYSPN